MTDEEIIEGYVKNVNSQLHPDENPFFWAWEEVTDLIGSDPERAWRVLLLSIQACATGREFIIGAGPLEELLVKFPRRFAERVAALVMSDTRFREAFSCINFSTEYCSAEDVEFFNATLSSSGAPAELLPYWRNADPDEAG